MSSRIRAGIHVWRTHLPRVQILESFFYQKKAHLSFIYENGARFYIICEYGFAVDSQIQVQRRAPESPQPRPFVLSLSLLCSRGVIALLPSLHRPPLHPSSNQRDIHVKKSQFIIFGRIRAKISGGNVRLVCFKGIQFGYMYSFFFYIQVSQIILVHRMLYY